MKSNINLTRGEAHPPNPSKGLTRPAKHRTATNPVPRKGEYSSLNRIKDGTTSSAQIQQVTRPPSRRDRAQGPPHENARTRNDQNSALGPAGQDLLYHPAQNGSPLIAGRVHRNKRPRPGRGRNKKRTPAHGGVAKIKRRHNRHQLQTPQRKESPRQ